MQPQTPVMNPTRAEARHAFLAATAWRDAVLELMPADMSYRRYFRLRLGERTRLLMDAPPPIEDVGPFIRIARHLAALGLHPPGIEAADEAAGFVLLEDFGDDTFTRLLDDGADPVPLYELAVDAILKVQESEAATGVDAPAFDRNHILDGAGWLLQWQLAARRGRPTSAQMMADWRGLWGEVVDRLPPIPDRFVFRDYHPGNLMRRAGQRGLAACGLLDFQDARIGSAAYDMMSLLEDARRDVPDDLVAAMRARYFERAAGIDREVFDAWFAALGAQQHARVGGLFVRFLVRDGNDGKLHHLPRVMRLLDRSLAAPHLSAVRDWLDRNMADRRDPLPDFDVAGLRSAMGAVPISSAPA